MCAMGLLHLTKDSGCRLGDGGIQWSGMPKRACWLLLSQANTWLEGQGATIWLLISSSRRPMTGPNIRALLVFGVCFRRSQIASSWIPEAKEAFDFALSKIFPVEITSKTPTENWLGMN